MVCIKDFSANQLRFSHREGPAVFAPRFNHSSGTKVVLRPAPAHFTFYAENSLAQRVHGDSEQSQKSKTPLLNDDEADHHNMLICHRNSRISFHAQFQNICQSHLICHLLSIFSTQKHLHLPKLQEEFGSRSEFEERATAYHFANALAILKACNERQAAEEMFQAGSTWRMWEELFPVSSYLSRFCPLCVRFGHRYVSVYQVSKYNYVHLYWGRLYNFTWLYGSIWYLSTGSQPPHCTARMKKLFHHSIQQSWRLDDSATHPTLNFPSRFSDQ